MSIKNTIVLSAAAFGSFYLCVTSLKLMQTNIYWAPFYYNCCVFGFSLGIIVSFIEHVKI